MRYLPEHRITFIHNPKTAGTSISQWLDDNFKTVEGRKHGNWKEVNEFFPNTIFTFGVVRNPWERLASWYMFAGHHSENFADWLTQRLMYGTGELSVGMSFKPQFSWARQWYNLGTPQADWLGDNVNLTLRFESLQEDFVEVQHILECDVELPVLNKSNLTDYKDLYTMDLVELVKDVYMKDIIRYGYKF